MPECKCSLRTKLVGDGCSVCNPDFYNQVIQQQIDDARDDWREEISFHSRYDVFEYGFDMISEYFTHE